jgi:NADPH:quinone reductase-like Zn-dependent oxidoreductase
LLHAGASNVGIAAIQLACTHKAADVFVTASSQEKIDFCKSLGAREGWNYKEQDWAQEVLNITNGAGVDLIVDPVGQSHFAGDLKCAAKDGAIVLLGFMSGPVVKELNLAPVLMKRLRVEGTTLRSRDVEYQGVLRDKVVEEALPRFESGEFKVPVEKVLSWTKVRDFVIVLETTPRHENPGIIIYDGTLANLSRSLKLTI